MIFGWATKNSAVTFGAMKKIQCILWGYKHLVVQCYFLKLSRKRWSANAEKYILFLFILHTSNHFQFIPSHAFIALS